MNPRDLRTFLSERLDQIEHELPAARAIVARLESEMEDIHKAARATGITLLSKEDRRTPSDFTNLTSKIEKTADYTMKDATIRILEGLPDGLTANQILDIMKGKFGLHYPRSSLSPQLSRLKTDKIVDRRDGRWILTKYIKHGEDEDIFD